MRILVVHNPVSGIRKWRDSAEVIRNYLTHHDVDFTWFETVPGDVQPLERISFATFDRVIVVGGDGTVRQVAHFLISHQLKIPIGIIAHGSADVLAMSLGIPTFPTERALAFALDTGSHAFDVMRVNQTQYALIAAGQGYDTYFMKQATRRLKRVWGIFAYLFAFLKTFFSYGHNAYKLVIDGKKHYVFGKSVMVFNVFSIVGIPLDETISPCDGVLNVLVLNPYSIGDVIQMAFLSLIRRPIHKIPRIQAFTGKHISIKAKHEKYIHVDGEILRGKSLQLEVVPSALHIICDKKF